MSKYSTELRYIIESKFPLGLDKYPIFSEEYRESLNQKILNHYYFNEIGFETAGKFKFYLNNTLNEIMPYYNQLYQSSLISINPLLTFERRTSGNKHVTALTEETLNNDSHQTIDNTTTSDQNEDTTQTNTTGSTKDTNANNVISDKDIFSDTPQALISMVTLENDIYATDARMKENTNVIDETEVLTGTNNTTSTIENNTVNTSFSTSNSTANADNKTNASSNEINVITENGYEIPLADLILKYRETFLNIDMLIINDLKDLFMMVY